MGSVSKRIIDTLLGPDIYGRNQKYVKPGVGILNYTTNLQPRDEAAFVDWVKKNNVPYETDNPNPQDYDMRGFYQALMRGDPIAKRALDPNDNRMHFPDYWKTPYHESFSNESKFAAKNAPHWEGDRLIGPDGSVIFDDKEANSDGEY